MSNKNVLAVFVIGLALLLAAFWAGLYLVGQQRQPATGKPSSNAAAPAAVSAAEPMTAPPVPDTPKPPEVSPDTRFIVQVSAYGTAEKANELVSRLKKQKYIAAYTQGPTSSDPLYRVCIGSFTVREDAQQIVNELSGEGYKGIMIVPTKPN